MLGPRVADDDVECVGNYVSHFCISLGIVSPVHLSCCIGILMVGEKAYVIDH